MPINVLVHLDKDLTRLMQPAFLSLSSDALGINHGRQLLRGAVDVVVQNQVLEISVLLDFNRSVAQTLFQFFGRVSVPAQQSIAQQVEGRRQNECRDTVRKFLPNAGGALNV